MGCLAGLGTAITPWFLFQPNTLYIAHTELENRKIVFPSLFRVPSLYRVPKNRDCLMRKFQIPRCCFSEPYIGNIPASKNQNMSPLLIFWFFEFLILDLMGQRKPYLPKHWGPSKNGLQGTRKGVGACPLPTANMTGQRFHRTTKMTGRHPWKSKSPFFVPDLLEQA